MSISHLPLQALKGSMILHIHTVRRDSRGGVGVKTDSYDRGGPRRIESSISLESHPWASHKLSASQGCCEDKIRKGSLGGGRAEYKCAGDVVQHNVQFAGGAQMMAAPCPSLLENSQWK